MTTHEHAATVTICTNAELVREHVLDLACRNLTADEREFVNASDGMPQVDVDSLVEYYVAAAGKVIWNRGDELGIEIDDRTDKHFPNWRGGKWSGYYHISADSSIKARELATQSIDAAEHRLAEMLGAYARGMIESEIEYRKENK